MEVNFSECGCACACVGMNAHMCVYKVGDSWGGGGGSGGCGEEWILK